MMPRERRTSREPPAVTEIDRIEATGYGETLYSNGDRHRYADMRHCDPIAPAERSARVRKTRARKRARRAGGEGLKRHMAKLGLTGDMIRHRFTALRTDWDWEYNVARVNRAAAAYARAKQMQEAASEQAPVPAAPSDPPPAASGSPEHVTDYRPWRPGDPEWMKPPIGSDFRHYPVRKA